MISKKQQEAADIAWFCEAQDIMAKLYYRNILTKAERERAVKRLLAWADKRGIEYEKLSLITKKPVKGLLND